MLSKIIKGYCSIALIKIKKAKDSFKLEWKFLNQNKEDKIWHEDIAGLGAVFLNETDEKIEYFKSKNVIDVGCGHGAMTTKIAEISTLAIGVELSKSIESAFENNKRENAWYVQADLQFLPFDDETFDLLYSSGVIHHTNNTELSLSLITPLIKNDGKICLWLYHPQKNKIHSISLFLRKFTKRLPLNLSFLFLIIFIFPVTYTLKKIKNKNPPNYREEIIDLLDHFTPEFRFEVPCDLACYWLQRRNFINIKSTTINQYGFSIVGHKRKY